MHFAYGRDTAEMENGTFACHVIQEKQARYNMVKAFLLLARNVTNCRCYNPNHEESYEEFHKGRVYWQEWYYLWALPSQFTPEKSSVYLKRAMLLFTRQTNCKDVRWRHTTLIYLMLEVLLEKARVQIQPGGTTEGETEKCNVWLLIGVLQETYGQLLPPITSPAPPL
jgi:hypothetical protein